MRSMLINLGAGLVLAFSALVVHAAEAGGVRFDSATTVEGEELTLNGAGVRTRFMFKVYVMGLYLPRQMNDSAAIIDAAGAKRIRIVLTRDLETKQFADALSEGLEKNHDAEALARLKPATDALRAALLQRPDAPSGTEVLLDALADGRTRLTVDGQQRGKDISLPAFFPALLRIWLGERPADTDLKQQLLGASR